ncbi:uncharacterized protein LOC121861258 [Homarus americanus]|uniref:uncharacterized protein LOC121861258 n=1 Tax=Homarus americanus TaxID=6706 RepID=UPI001C43ED05|nr:uncharacterized protein LOC121861258 [Homarus americanus]
MTPYQEGTSHSSDSSGNSEDGVAPLHDDLRSPGSSPRARSSSNSRYYMTREAQVGMPEDGEGVVMTDLEDEEGAASPPGGVDDHSGEDDDHHEGYLWSREAAVSYDREGGRGVVDGISTHSVDDDDDPESWWTESGPVATVKLVLETGVGVITRAWPLHQPAHALKAQLSLTTQVPAHFLQLVVRGRVLSDESTLRSVGVEANETVQVGVSSKRPHSHPLTLLAPTTPTLPTPDVITVIVAEGGVPSLAWYY